MSDLHPSVRSARRFGFAVTIVAINVAIHGGLWLLDNSGSRLANSIAAYLALWPSPHFEPWQLITYAFLHGDFTHLLFNMFGLWMFGKEMERVWGVRRMALYYFVCVVGAGLAQLGFAFIEGSNAPTIGASGGVFGILLAFGLTFPNRRILLLIPPIPLKAKWVVIGYGVIELWLGVTGTMAGIAHFAHLGGMVVGAVLIVFWRRKGINR